MTELFPPAGGAVAPASPPQRRSWFPLVWPVALAGIWLAAALIVEDRGLLNSMKHAAIILTAVGWTIWLLGFSQAPSGRRWGLAALIMGPIVAFYFQLLPIETVNDGDVGIVGIRWRWADPDRDLAPPTNSDQVSLDWQATPTDYPAFLGGKFFAQADDPGIAVDWEANPPRQLWKQRIGAGWSGFAVVGDYAVTQEQRGDEELVTCYDISTGKPVWSHSNPVRFDPSGGGSLGGIGPRATPTIHDGRVYAHGATGIVDCLDASTGEAIWSVDTVAELNAAPLLWGKSSSPIVDDGLVIVSIGDPAANITPDSDGQGHSLVALSAETGELVWSAGDRRASYATPVMATLGGVEQILVVNEAFLTSHDADDGTVLWEHPWPGDSDANASTSQPVPVGDDRVLLSKGYGEGAELIQINRDGDDWAIERVWKKPVLKTKFCNVVVHDGFVYALDDANLQCVQLASGKQAWKKRRRPRFGHGQLLLVGDRLLVLTEEGEVVLVATDPKKYEELASLPAIEGVTWNNPTLVGDRLLVRNAEWAACFQLPTTAAPSGNRVAETDR
ncbi:MAG: PQQ-like beta-propeller repeat protein [Planctomycetales bacterium]|nr:PQQ-like beta-propeller repeat protein [Planctomycetales bacterium]